MAQSMIDYYTQAGFSLELLAASPYHREKPIGAYFHNEILPAIYKGQCRFYLTDENIPAALVTWAWLSEAVEREVHETGRALRYHEWNCGDRMFINDWITPYDNMREVLRDMMRIFPNNQATSIRRNTDGTVRRINRWVRTKSDPVFQNGASE